MHADHSREATTLQYVTARITAWLGRPRSLIVASLVVAMWVSYNSGASFLHHGAFDPPPFSWLQGIVALAAFFVTMLVLTTQQRDDVLASRREQLTLQLAMLSDQKSAKIVQLLEELRRDHPNIENRIDPEAIAMSSPADPHEIFDAMKETHEAITEQIEEERARI